MRYITSTFIASSSSFDKESSEFGIRFIRRYKSGQSGAFASGLELAESHHALDRAVNGGFAPLMGDSNRSETDPNSDAWHACDRAAGPLRKAVTSYIHLDIGRIAGASMKIRKLVTMLGALSLVLPFASQAQVAAPACTSEVKAEGPLAPWNEPVKLAADHLVLGQAAMVNLRPTPEVRYALTPERDADDKPFGGVFTLTISEAGTYRVALATGGWIDVVGGGKAVVSRSHAHGPACTTIRKMVDFQLMPGTYTVQIAANPTPQTTVLVTRMP